jgi:formiminotetrahydrofolate cyclodeaminase
MSSVHIRSLGDAPASIWALDASRVRDLTASLSPTPGGGAISVFTATLGLALVHKGASISLKRVGDDLNRHESLHQLCEQISSALEAISRLADDDSQSFQDYITARSLPRATDEEKISRDTAMEVAIQRAARIPLASAKSICGALELAEKALQLSDLHLLYDVFGGAILMQAASKAVLLNVGANVALFADIGMRAAVEAERSELERVSLERSEAVERAYAARMTDSEDFAGR